MRRGSVRVEEFIPTDDVDHMLGVAENLLALSPQQTKATADDLRRAMVWMKKYIGPTSEYWRWKPFSQPVGHQVELRVSFVGLGWLVGLERHTSDDDLDARLVEQELVSMLDKITSTVPVEAVLRLKASPWSNKDLADLKKYLNARLGAKVSHRGSGLLLPSGIILTLGEKERLQAVGLSKAMDMSVRTLLRDIKEWVNDTKNFEGADWCAYKRRRLTTLTFRVEQGLLSPTPEDFRLTDETTGLYQRQGDGDFDLVYERGEKETPIASVIFPVYPYHLGVLNPRMVVRAVPSCDAPRLENLQRYYSYLWVNHYTRLWRYLELEDQFAYTGNVRRLRELDDSEVYSYVSRLLAADELRASIDLANRVDDGKLSAYKPPHDELILESGKSEGLVAAQCLRLTLIPSTVTQLSTDPLRTAPRELQEATSELIRTYSTFAQAASLRMQRSLQVLQVLFVVAGVAQVLSLVPIAAILAGLLRDLFSALPWYTTASGWKASQAWLGGVSILTVLCQIFLLVMFTLGALIVLRTGRLTRSFRRFLG